MSRALPFFFLVKTWTKVCEFFCSKAYDNSSLFRVVNFPVKNTKLHSSSAIVCFCHTLKRGESRLNFLLLFSCSTFLVLCWIQRNWSKSLQIQL